MRPYEEPMLNVQFTADELTAINIAIGYYRRHLRHISPAYDLTCQLLDQFQNRVRQQVVDQQSLGQIGHYSGVQKN
ncbi:MAG TPA: hypothetical protein VKR06_21760 [Ktedonosporobacter sp.]|nr:hypothetical protein [Ktedonosporobacter sp.]